MRLSMYCICKVDQPASFSKSWNLVDTFNQHKTDSTRSITSVTFVTLELSIILLHLKGNIVQKWRITCLRWGIYLHFQPGVGLILTRLAEAGI